MIRIVFVSRNRRLIERITAALHTHKEVLAQLLSVSIYQQVEHAVDVFNADVVIVDATGRGNMSQELFLCKNISYQMKRRCFLIIDEREGMGEEVSQAIKYGIIEKIIPYVDSMDQLLHRMTTV